MVLLHVSLFNSMCILDHATAVELVHSWRWIPIYVYQLLFWWLISSQAITIAALHSIPMHTLALTICHVGMFSLDMFFYF